VVRPAGQEPDRVRLAGAADRRPRRAAGELRAAPARPRGRAHRGVVGGAAQGRAPAALRAARGRGPARRPGAPPRRVGRRRRGGRGGVDLVPAPPRGRAAGLSLRSRLGRLPGRPWRRPRRARARGRHAAGPRPRRGGTALPVALLGGAQRGGADAGHRRPPRHRGRLVGDPGGRAQGAARHADGPHRARRLRARGLPRRRAQRRLARHALRHHAPGPRPRGWPTRRPTWWRR
jgi:hypothetical protein